MPSNKYFQSERLISLLCDGNWGDSKEVLSQTPQPIWGGRRNPKDADSSSFKLEGRNHEAWGKVGKAKKESQGQKKRYQHCYHLNVIEGLHCLRHNSEF